MDTMIDASEARSVARQGIAAARRIQLRAADIQFSSGDTVRCLDVHGVKTDKLSVGAFYTVLRDCNDSGFVDIHGVGTVWARRFRRVMSANS